MVDLEKKLNTLVAKVKNYFVGTEKIESKTILKKKQRLNLILLIVGGFVSFLSYYYF
jgi:hypothetical protein